MNTGLELTIGEDIFQVEGAFTDIVVDGEYYPKIPLLGMKTIFDKYKITINSSEKVVDLEPY